MSLLEEDDRKWFARLSEMSHPLQVGGKFSGLQRAYGKAMIPNAVCLYAEAARCCVPPEAAAAMRAFFVDARDTVGAFFSESYKQMQQSAEAIAVSPTMRASICRSLTQAFGPLEKMSLAVRSSAVDEDGQASSFAGVYTSYLRVVGIDAVVDAIQQCWRSYYCMAAIATRLANGDYSWEPRMAVIVQQMLSPELAGVAIGSHQDDVIDIAFDYGTAEKLVAGLRPGRRAAAQTELPAFEANAVACVDALVRQLSRESGTSVDVEWAWSNPTLHLLQVRPVVAPRVSHTERRDSPYVETHNLYFDDAPPSSQSLGPCAEIYGSYVSKRAWAYRKAASLGVVVGHGIVLTFNGLALADGAVADALPGKAPDLIFDIGTGLRQLVVARTETAMFLKDLIGAHDPQRCRTVLVREFIRGNFGFISTLTSRGEVMIEGSPKGLLAMNRGLSDCEQIVVSEDGDISQRNSEFRSALSTHLSSVVSLTQCLAQQRPGIQLEWVLEKSPVFVDFSLSGTLSDEVSAQRFCLSPGVCGGPPLALHDDVLLERLSIGPATSVTGASAVAESDYVLKVLQRIVSHESRPVILAKCPYAILSVLIPHVAGFVFQQGSALCHLALLLREAGVPAALGLSMEHAGAKTVRIADGLVWMEA